MKSKKFTAALLSCALTCCVLTANADAMEQQMETTTTSFEETTTEVTTTYVAETLPSAEQTENPFNKQDDKEVPYDGTLWVQPKDWNVPTIDPRDYDGGLMIYFDKIGLYPEDAHGKVQRVYVSVIGAEEPVSLIKFHIFYDTRLKLSNNTDNEVLRPGKAVQGFTTGSKMVEEGQIAFYAYSNEDVVLDKGSLFTIDFIVPENAEPGEVYPIGMAYVDDGIVCDTFIDAAQDDAGKLQMTYAFTKGIYNGYIKIIGEKRAVETTAVTTETVTTMVTADSSGNDATTSDTTETTTKQTEESTAPSSTITETTVESIPETSEATQTATPTEPVGHIASDEVLCSWAVKDYQDKTGETDVQAAVTAVTDSIYQITLTDREGNALDFYTIDPVNGIGTNTSQEIINLPQTGNRSMKKLLVFLISVMLSGFGIAAIKFSGVIRRRKSE